uniref:Uncharacterized protein n=1 Tax=Denticeps clupeoides TaxID=299321 RepID=A0AAY4AS87_9TELE
MAEVKTELLWTTKVMPAPTMMAMYPVTQPKGNGKSVVRNITNCCSPVLMIFLMTKATWPFSIELRSFTIKMRHRQSTSREEANKIKPTTMSDRLVSTKMWLPVETH